MKWMLCDEAKAEAVRSGIVITCDALQHICKSSRTQFLWDARDESGKAFSSEQPHCGSCLSDDEYSWRGSDEACCCVHRVEGETKETGT